MRRGAVLIVICGGVLLAWLAGPATGSVNGAATPSPTKAASPSASPVALVGNAESGKELSSRCTICHSTNGGIGIGPTWKGLYGSTVELDDGTIVTADEAYLTRSIKEPSAQVVKGFSPGTMPNFGSVLTDQQIADLVAYIKTLANPKS